MKLAASVSAFALAIALSAPAIAFIKRGGPGGGPPPPVIPPSNNGYADLPEIVGLDIVGSTLTARMGTWSGSPTPTFACSWHMIGGPQLSSNCASFGPLVSGQVGQNLILDVTATSTNGVTSASATATSWWVGPITSAARTLPVPGPGPAPTSLPTYPENIFENGHYVYPGCTPPGPAPTFTGASTHAWYFDSVNGHTQDTPATGHFGDPFKDVAAILSTGISGYSGGALFNRTIQPGDTIYIKADPTGASVGNISGSAYSGALGTPNFTWVQKDPASTLNPVIGDLVLSASAGWVFDRINVEQTGFQTVGYSENGAPMVSITGNVAAPTQDIYFENGSLTSWLGHSNDPRDPSTYPTTGGHSDGTIQTASPFAFATPGGVNVSGSPNLQDPPNIPVTATTGTPTKLFITAAPAFFTNQPFPLGYYVWSPGYYYQQGYTTGTAFFPLIAPINTGIPNGSIIQDFQGRTNLTYKGTLASPPTGAGVLNDAWMTTSDNHLWTCNVSTCGSGTWTDSGAMYMTIGACDTVGDADTGCTQTPIQCDPRIPPAAACGGSPVWTGVTRNMTGAAAHDFVTITPRMVILPSGWWNALDWDYAQAGMQFSGQRVGGGNDIEGTQCINTKNNLIRWVNSNMILSLMVNSTQGGNWMKYRAQDSTQVLSSHRLIIARSFGADVSFDRGHPDIFQQAQNSGGNGDFLYGNAFVDNEFYTYSDPLNPFPFFTQGVTVTDQVYSGVYMANNILFNTQNASGGGGLFHAIVHNDMFMDRSIPAGQLQVKSGNKANLSVPAQSLMANNVANAFSRTIIPGTSAAPIQPTNFGGAATTCASNTPAAGQYTVTMHVGGAGQPATSSFSTGPNVNGPASNIVVSGFVPNTAPTMNGTYLGTAGNNSTTVVGSITANGGACPTFTTEGNVTIGPASCSYDQNTVSNNLQIPAIDYVTGIASISNTNYCDKGTFSTVDKLTNGNRAGVWNDLISWTPIDYRSGTANPPFNDFSPIMPDPSGTSNSGTLALSTCLRNEFNLGTCVSGDAGRLDLRPNSAFVSTSASLTGMTTTAAGIPVSGVIGDKWLLQAAAACNGGFPICGATFGPFIMPAGLYTRCANGTTFVPPCIAATPSGTFAAYGSSVTGGVLTANNGPFSPGLIGAGVNLGAQQPPADHARRAWHSSPAIGAYEGP